MKYIKNFRDLSVGELLHEFYNLGDDMYNPIGVDIENNIRLNTNGYDKWLMKSLYDDIESVLAFKYRIHWRNEKERTISRFAYDMSNQDLDKLQDLDDEEKRFFKELIETCDVDSYEFMQFIINEAQFKTSDNLYIKNRCGAYNTAMYGQMVYYIFNDEYGVPLDDDSSEECDRNERLRNIKRPTNTLRKQIALLEHTGIIDHLSKEYAKNDLKMSELLSNILNRDQQNIREMLSFSKTKDRESNKPENVEFINKLFDKLNSNGKKE